MVAKLPSASPVTAEQRAQAKDPMHAAVARAGQMRGACTKAIHHAVSLSATFQANSLTFLSTQISPHTPLFQASPR